jgi:hypothetical protein
VRQSSYHKKEIPVTQRELNRAVARATGESLATVTRMGFGRLRTIVEEREPLILDWDRVEAERTGLFPPRRRRRAATV